MNTKVKGNKIKEGSIPLSALADDVKGEFNGKYGLSGYCGTLGRDNKTVDTNAYFRSVVYIKYENRIANASIGTYSLHDLFPSSAPIPGNIIVYKKGEKLSLDLQEDNNYWDNLKIFSELYDVPIPETPTPNWNAQLGGAGYIENRTHHANFARIEYDEENNKGKYEIATFADKLLLLWRDKYFTVHRNKTLTIDVSYGEDTFIVNHNGTTLFITDSYGYLKNEYKYMSVSEDIIPLTEAFIPNTVLKTTPQTLSDADKNQALANLGIDPVVWKYICNPFVIKIDGEECYVPEELVDLDSLADNADYGKKVYTWKYLIPAMYVGYNDMDGNYFAVTYGETSRNRITLSFNEYNICIDEEFKIVY